MYDLGDELTVESYRIPWLIWIQLLVLFLLFFLLFSFSLFSSPSDLSLHSASTPAASSSASPSPNSHLGNQIFKHTPPVRNRFQLSQAVENQSIKGEIATSTSRRIVRDDDIERESSFCHVDHHPCNYFRLAKLAFLKCLGLDSPSENSSRSERKKDR